MKFNQFVGLCTVCVGLMVFTACQKDELATPATKDAQVAPRSHDCSTVCIDPAGPVYHEDACLVEETAGPNYRRFNFTVHNTLTGFVVNWTYSASTPTPRRLNFTVSGAGFSAPLSFTTACVTTTTSGSSTFNFNQSWAACGVVNFSAKLTDCDGIVKSTKTSSYNLVGECGVACSESFSYVNNGDGTYTFTYVPSADAPGAVLVFTFAQSERVTVGGLAGWTNNGQTYQNTLDLEACVTYSWTVSLTPKCSGHSGHSNLWTDFKVNNISKKNSGTPNIVATCP